VLLNAARDAFTQGLHLAAAVGAVIAIGIALMVSIRLRDVRGGAGHGAEAEVEPASAPAALEPCTEAA
jgi:hypothetical protein